MYFDVSNIGQSGHKSKNELIKFLISAVDLLIYLLSPWSRALLENLRGFQLVKKFPTFYGTRRFITLLISEFKAYTKFNQKLFFQSAVRSVLYRRSDEHKK